MSRPASASPPPPRPPPPPLPLPLPLPEAILLDALGTLIGIRPPDQPLVDLLAERHGIVIGLADARRGLRAEMAYYREHCQQAADRESLTRLRLACAELLAREIGGPVAELPPAELTGTLLAALEFAAYPEAPDVLRRLRAAGIRLVVVSNWDISIFDALERTGLLHLLDGVVCSAAVGCAKPGGGIFAAGLALAGVTRERALHVGDSLEEDVLGANAAGISAVLLARPIAGRGGLIGASARTTPDAVRTIASLGELLPRAGAG